MFRCRFVMLSQNKLLLFMVLIGVLTGCNVDPNATPISMFPTRIPEGTKLPTFVAIGTTPQPNPSGLPPTPQVIQATIRPTSTFRFVSGVTTTPRPTVIPTLDANWTTLARGVQWRRLTFRASDNRDVGTLVVRIDPAGAQIKVKYNPGEAKIIQEWRATLPGAVVIANANFFDRTSRPLGLVSVDGTLTGASTGRRDSGLFQVKNGTPKVRSLFLEPYTNTEFFEQVVQGFPIMMVGGQVAPGFDPDLTRVSARRTVIAQDRRGRLLIINTPFSNVTLVDLANWLGRSGLEIDTALNLDGGNSTCMYLATGGPSEYTLNLQPVPVVLAVYPR